MYYKGSRGGRLLVSLDYVMLSLSTLGAYESLHFFSKLWVHSNSTMPLVKERILVLGRRRLLSSYEMIWYLKRSSWRAVPSLLVKTFLIKWASTLILNEKIKLNQPENCNLKPLTSPSKKLDAIVIIVESHSLLHHKNKNPKLPNSKNIKHYLVRTWRISES